MQVLAPGLLSDHYDAAFRAKDLDALVSLYEPGATLSPRPGVDVRGAAAIRERLAGLMALTGTLETSDPVCIMQPDGSWKYALDVPHGGEG